MKILTPEQLREIDRLSTEKYGIPSILLMENAGMRVVEVLKDHFEDLETLTIAVLCGRGNNGGDGFVVARQLIQNGCFPFVFLFGPESDVKGDAKTNLQILKAIGYPPAVVLDEREWSEEKLELLDADIIVDALLGTGARTQLEGVYRTVIESLEEDFPRATIVSVDVPSPGVRPDITVTFSALKPSLVLSSDGGDVILANIGNPPELLDSDEYKLNLIRPHDLPPREKHSNKGNFGRVLIIGGSRGKTGAASMAGQAALRSGAGLVTVATAASVLTVIAGSMPELMTHSLLETPEGTIANQAIPDVLNDKTVLAIGPGVGALPETSAFVRRTVGESSIPAVIDADGINAFVGYDGDLRGNGRAIIITPHPGEMARLIQTDVASILANRIEVARSFAVEHKIYVVLKGFRTVLATPDGSIFINPTGNPGMATAGTGDILTGMMAGILAQEYLGSFVERLCLAVYLHGLAGDLAADEIGQEPMVATDLLRLLPRAWENLRSETHRVERSGAYDFPLRTRNV